MQVKLLRAIQEKRVRPVGAETEVDVDVRLISATHKNLQDAVMEGTFRSDLFYRLNVIDIHMPSLRQRPEDIEPLTQRFLNQLSSNGKAIELSNSALDALRYYNFPGNVRELENILERAATLCENNRIEVTDLKLHGDSGGSQEQSNLNRPERQPEQIDSLDEHLEEIEKEILLDTLERSRWNKTAAAKKLGISFRSIRYRLQKLGLDD